MPPAVPVPGSVSVPASAPTAASALLRAAPIAFGIGAAHARHEHLQLLHGIRRDLHVFFVQEFLRKHKHSRITCHAIGGRVVLSSSYRCFIWSAKRREQFLQLVLF